MPIQPPAEQLVLDDERSGFTHGLLDIVGPLATRLKARFILPVAILVGTILALLSTGLFAVNGAPNPGWRPWVITFGVIAALAVILDKIADAYDSRDADIEFKGAEYTAQSSVSDLNAFLEEAIEIAFLEKGPRAYATQALRKRLVHFACKSIGPGSRATYYTLDPIEPGERVLGDPQHAVELGRRDKPARPFIERESPEHDVWAILDGADEAPDVKNAPEPVGDMSWERKPYDTFLTVPVKARGVQFGLLSVNNVEAESIGEAQRATIVAMARVMATVLAFTTGNRKLTTRDTTPLMSVDLDSVIDEPESGQDDDQDAAAPSS